MFAYKNITFSPYTKYFVLVPLSDTKTKITVPAENPITLSRIHSLLPSNEIEAIIEEIPFLETIWIDNDNQRKNLEILLKQVIEKKSYR